MRSAAPPSPWEKEEIFIDGESYFQRMIESMDQAVVSIELESYIFDSDALGRRIVDALKRAAQRGIRVRVMVDGVGSPGWNASFARELKGAGGESRIFHPLSWNLLGWMGADRHPRSLGCLEQFNRRNHRKTCIIDKRVALVGGMNISADHRDWRDTSVRVEGPAVALLTDAFDAAWERRKPRRANHHQSAWDSLIKLNNTNRKRRHYFRERLFRIRSAKKRIWITTPYFVPSFKMVRALRSAARSKVDVRILLPGKADVIFMSWVNSAYYFALLQEGVRIFEYRPTMIHAKVLEVDDWVTIGSTNLNHRSLIHDLEADVVLSQTKSVRALDEQFLSDLRNSEEITLESWEKASLSRKAAGKVLLFFRYWI
jgi:cardiolipin synthase